jgi:hypothetical protein
MKEVKIQIENAQLADLGLEPEMRYTPFRFNENLFIGYWISNNDTTISFYIGDQCFLCRNCQKNIDIFESILNPNGAKTDI